MDRIKRISAEILTDHRESFGVDFSENKKISFHSRKEKRKTKFNKRGLEVK